MTGAASSIKSFQHGYFKKVRSGFGIETKAMVEALGVKRVLGSLLVGDIAGQ